MEQQLHPYHVHVHFLYKDVLQYMYMISDFLNLGNHNFVYF